MDPEAEGLESIQRSSQPRPPTGRGEPIQARGSGEGEGGTEEWAAGPGRPPFSLVVAGTKVVVGERRAAWELNS